MFVCVCKHTAQYSKCGVSEITALGCHAAFHLHLLIQFFPGGEVVSTRTVCGENQGLCAKQSDLMHALVN